MESRDRTTPPGKATLRNLKRMSDSGIGTLAPTTVIPEIAVCGEC